MSTRFPVANARVSGLPVYEPGRPIFEVARELGFDDLSDIVKVASNENALGPSPKALAAIHDSANDMHLYPDGGTYELRQAIAEALDLSPANILPGNGSNELIELLGHVYLGEGTNIVMAQQAFIVYRLVAAAFGATVIDVPMKDFAHDLEAMLAAITDQTRIVFIANPNNPTGTSVSPDALEQFIDRVPPHVLVCIDEAYIELMARDEQPRTLAWVRDERPVIILRTFSKTYGLAGLRVGYGMAAPELIALLHRVRQPFNVNAMAQTAAIAAIADDQHVKDSRTLVEDGLQQLSQGFDALGLPYVPSVANFMLVHVGQGRAVFDALRRAGIIVRPMDAYGLPEYVRVTVGTHSENERVLKAMGTVLAPARS